MFCSRLSPPAAPLWLHLVVGVIVALHCVPAQAQHLWDYRRPERVYPHADTQAWGKGDLLTVLVQESTDVQNNDSRALDRSSQAGGSFDFSTALSGQIGRLAGDSAVSQSMQNNNSFDGSSQYNVDRGFTARITVRVHKVLSNGNLVIHGSRRQFISGEHRTLTVMGIVRPWDIRADNTIASQYISDFRLCYTGDGAETAYSNQGWLARRINRLLPF
ncbi:MAG: flagellar basal body L-ring protein FlgH [Planctomycetales bacterium]|nr:flagellar basal body L-ring protein FlgH [Planctomycetales bacterium]